MSLSKHRDESEVFGIDFTARLSANETISSPMVAVRKQTASGTWLDVSSEFGSPAGVADGTGKKVSFTLGASMDQDATATYAVYCSVVTSDGETLVEVVDLKITDRAGVA